MKKKYRPIPRYLKPYISDKRDELVWSISIQDGFNLTDIASMFNVDPAVMTRIIKRRPENWQSKWKKVTSNN